MEYFKVTKRCIRCRKPLRDDGTCQNPKCVRYKPEAEKKYKVTASDADTTAKTDANGCT